MKTIYFFSFILFLSGSVAAQETIPLVPPQKSGGMPLMEALAKRSTARAFDSPDLSDTIRNSGDADSEFYKSAHGLKRMRIE